MKILDYRRNGRTFVQITSLWTKKTNKFDFSASKSCVFQTFVVPLQRITDEIYENKQFSSVENKGSTMINRESYLSQLIKLRDQDLIKVQHGKKYMIIS